MNYWDADKELYDSNYNFADFSEFQNDDARVVDRYDAIAGF